jgi:hypothetical protein
MEAPIETVKVATATHDYVLPSQEQAVEAAEVSSNP